jgi:hypothetical protein
MLLIKLLLAGNNYAIGGFSRIRSGRFQEILKFQKCYQQGKNNFISDIPGFPAGDGEHSLSILTVHHPGFSQQKSPLCADKYTNLMWSY